MKEIDFTKTGGMPFDQQTLEFMQNAYSEPLKRLTGVFGDYIIIQGAQSTGGWVAVNGEIMPFTAGVGDDCYIITDTQSVMFENGEIKGIYKQSRLVFGVGSNPLKWSNFKPIQIKGIDRKIWNVEEKLPRRYGDTSAAEAVIKMTVIQDNIAQLFYLQGEVTAEGYTSMGSIGLYLAHFYTDWANAIKKVKIVAPKIQNINLANIGLGVDNKLTVDPNVSSDSLVIRYEAKYPSINYFTHTFYYDL